MLITMARRIASFKQHRATIRAMALLCSYSGDGNTDATNREVAYRWFGLVKRNRRSSFWSFWRNEPYRFAG
jgi:hypothetical protein